MNKQHKTLAAILLLLTLGLCPLHAALADNDSLLTSLQTEINRSMQGLKMANAASPCFIDFRLTDLNTVYIRAMRGEVVYANQNSHRNGLPTVLVGDYQNTNQNVIMNYQQLYNYRSNAINVVFGSDDAVIRTCIWQVLDKNYKDAAELYANKMGLLKQTEVPEEDRNIPDFQRMEATRKIFPVRQQTFDLNQLKEYVRKASEVFKEYHELDNSHIYLYAGSADVRYSNSEGTLCRYPDNLISIFINARAQSADGEEINELAQLLYSSIEELPTQKELEDICRGKAELIQQKLAASMIKESYVGPVLFEGEAVADLVERYFADPSKGVMGKRKGIATAEINRYYSDNPALEGNQLEPMVNKKVISRDLTLSAMSGTPEYRGQKLLGYYPVDVQGVEPDKELALIKDGVLKNMLTMRMPTRQFRTSNGHARSSINGGNLLLCPGVLRLSSKTSCAPDELKKRLMAAAKEEDYSYAYIVRKITNDTPSQLYRVNVSDGSEELVRGATMKDISLRTFKRISGVSGQENIYNRIRDDVKSTYITPSAILLDEVDIAKDSKLVLKKSYAVDKPTPGK